MQECLVHEPTILEFPVTVRLPLHSAGLHRKSIAFLPIDRTSREKSRFTRIYFFQGTFVSTNKIRISKVS
jgi:hypothetical protein